MRELSDLIIVEIANERISHAGKLLTDMGATVLLIEPPEGCATRRYPPFAADAPDDVPEHERSLYFWHYNTHKNSVTLDFNDAIDREHLRLFIERADILLEATTPGTLEAMGLGWQALQAANPELIHAALTSHGQAAPESKLPHTDLTLMAAGGPPWSCGYDDHSLPPVRGWGNQAFHTGCHYVVMSVLTALLDRLYSDKGQFIDVSLTAALNVTTEAASYAHLVAGKEVQRQTGRHASVEPTGETQMLCADGRYVNTGVPPRFPEEFGKLHAWMSELGLVEALPEAVFLEMGANWEGPFDLSQIGVDDTITAIFGAGREALKFIASRVSAEEFFLGCQQAGLAVGVINSPEEAFENEHFKARGFQIPVTQPQLGREVMYPGKPFQLSETAWRGIRPAPALGEHNDIFLGINRDQMASQ